MATLKSATNVHVSFRIEDGLMEEGGLDSSTSSHITTSADTQMHHGKKPSRERQCDAVGGVLLPCMLDTYQHCCRLGSPCEGDSIP